MMPQVNLLDSLGQHHTKIKASTWFAMLLLGFAIIAGASYIQSDWVSKKQARLAVEQQRNTELTQEMANFEQVNPNQKIEREVQSEIAQLRAELQIQKTTLALVAPDAGVQRKGFYTYLAALSDRSRQGLWLTNIELNPGLHQARLTGQTLDPALVPMYLDSLTDTVFSELQFSRMNMKKISDNPSVYSFDLDSKDTLTPYKGLSTLGTLNTLRVSP
jgi:hypothetical protein